MNKEMELEIKFQNETTADLERQIIKIVRKYAAIKCNQEKNKKNLTDPVKNIIYKNDNEYIERINDDQLINILGISKRNISRCY